MKTDHAEVYKIPYNMLKFTGGWPVQNSSTLYKVWGIFVYNISSMLAFTMLMEAYKCRNDFAKLSEILFIMVMVVVYLFKHGAVFYHGKTFAYMVELLKKPILSSYPDELNNVMRSRARISQIIANSYRTVVSINIILIGLSPYIDKTPLPFPFSYDLGNYRPLMYFFQVIAIASNAWNNCAMDCLTLSLAGIAVTQLEILAKKITHANRNGHAEELCRGRNCQEFSEYEDEIILKYLKQCVKHHLITIEYIELIDKILSFAILSQFLASVLIICNTLFHFVLIPVGSSQFFMLLSFIVVAVWQLFIYCWYGNEIIWKSLNIGESCFVFDWYKYGNRVRKLLFIVMERSKRPLSISAFKFATVSLRAFMSVMQWSYSYFALLVNLYKKRNLQ